MQVVFKVTQVCEIDDGDTQELFLDLRNESATLAERALSAAAVQT